MMKRTIIYIFLTFVSTAMNAQTLKAYLNAAEEAMLDKDYYNAAYYYSEAVKFPASDLDVRYNYANASMLFNALGVAEQEFRTVIDQDSVQSYPLALFNLAEVLQRLEKYDEAQYYYNLYGTEYGNVNRETKKAKNEVDAIDWARPQLQNPTAGLQISRLENDVNTPYSEFGPVMKDGKLYYFSNRFEIEEKKQKVKRHFSKVLEVSENQTSLMLGDEFNGRGSHVGNLAFNSDGSKIYYTICEYKNTTDVKCEIYSSSVAEDGTWTAGIKLPSTINDTSSTTTQPSIGYDLNIDKEILYFVSDRKDGSGQLDIWYSVIQDEDYSVPINLKEINTEYNEITPFFHAPTGNLFFSTNGKKGMGGYDVFKTHKSSSGFEEPINLGWPTNKSYDDIYYVINDEETKAYLSSNRLGSLVIDDRFEACCFDIYKLDIEEVFIDVSILTFDENTREALDGARVSVTDPITGEIIFDSVNPIGNTHDFKLKCNREFLITCEKEGYETNESIVTTGKCSELETIIAKKYLKPKTVRLDVFTFDELSQAELDSCTVTLINLSKPELEPIVVEGLNGNYSKFDILVGEEYELIATRKGYISTSLIVNSNNVINGVVTEELYLGKSVNVFVDFIPVVVYFDNDRPNRRSKSMYTELSYSDTYDEYVAVTRRNEFRESWAKTLEAGELETGHQTIDSFFDNEVLPGYARLKKFIAKLKMQLEAGSDVEISIKGFASPRAKNQYNLALGQRRIWTLKNELSTWGGAALGSYIASGQLKVSEISFGEEIAPPGISDAYENPRSVYSIEASRQRKAEIVEVRILN